MKTPGQNPPVPPPGGENWDDFAGLPEDAPTRVVPAAPIPPPSAAKKAAPPAKGASKPLQEMAGDIPVQVVCVLGKKNVTVADVAQIKDGEVIDLDRFPHDAVDLVVNGKTIAKGELVEIDGKLGVRIIKLFETK